MPRSSFQERRLDHPYVTAEEGFEDVGLNDEVKPVKKRGLFARFGDNSDATVNSTSEPRPTSSHHTFHIPGRKRGQSGQGAELRSMGDRPTSARTEVPVEAR
jgi:hypothetical protein